MIEICNLMRYSYPNKTVSACPGHYSADQSPREVSRPADTKKVPGTTGHSI